MTLRQQISDLTEANADIKRRLAEKDGIISALEDKLADKIWPKESAIEDFESAVINATKKVLDSLRTNS